MSEKEREILQKLSEIVPKLPDTKKERLLRRPYRACRVHQTKWHYAKLDRHSGLLGQQERIPRGRIYTSDRSPTVFCRKDGSSHRVSLPYCYRHELQGTGRNNAYREHATRRPYDSGASRRLPDDARSWRHCGRHCK